MAGGFGDLASAARFRDIAARITRKIISEERPEPRIGKVYSVDTSAQVASILFAGETADNLIKARYAKNMEPQVVMVDNPSMGLEAPADIVRVWGKPGNYFILDYYAGGPVPITETPLIGVPMPWFLPDPPDERYIILDGIDRSRSTYSQLFALWGTKFGVGDGVETFGVPNGADRALVGASGTIGLGGTGGAKTKALAAANLPPHAHTINHYHTQIKAGTEGGNLDWASGTVGGVNAGIQTGTSAGVRSSNGVVLVTGDFNGSSGNGPGTSSPVDIQNPYLGVNWMVRAIA